MRNWLFRVRRRERERLVTSLSFLLSGFSSLSILPIPLLSIEAYTNSFSNVVATISVSACTTYVLTSPFMSAKPDLPYKSFSDSSDEPSRKRKRERFGSSSSGFSRDVL